MINELVEKYQLGSKDDRELYHSLELLLDDLSKDAEFEVAGSGIGGENFSIDFSIVTPKPKGLPKEVTDLFFNNLDFRYKVNIKETDLYQINNERHFQFELIPNKLS